MAKVRDILEEKGGDVVTLTPGESVLNAARLMNERGIGGLVIVEGDQPAGIFTERDILRRVVADNRDPGEVKVGEVMTTAMVSCRPDATLEQCSALMTDKRIRHLPVVDEGQLKGIVTSGDILAYQVRQQQETIDYLNSYVFDLRT